MTDSRFSLFRLPFLALCKVLDFYGPHDIIQLSFCSKRSLRVTKKCWKKKGKIMAYLWADIGPRVSLYFYDSGFGYRFVISEVQYLHNQQTQMIRIGDAVIPSIHRDRETVTYWKNTITGIEEIVRYIKYLFDVPITSIDLRSEDYKNEFIETMDCIMSMQGSVEDCTLHSEDSTDECLTHLLNNCKITEKLRLYEGPARKFKNEWKICPKYLHISYGLCLTFQNLTNINCQSLKIQRSSLTSEDVNQFLKHWQNGGNSRIRYVYIVINFMNHEVVTSGIETVPQPETVRRCYPCSNLTVMINGGLDIKRNDGKTGTIYIHGDMFRFGVDPIDGFS
ncbi:unnamed protein product [Caenorhabditis brenneri]